MTAKKFLVNQDQFGLYFDQLEKLIKKIEDWKNGQLPPNLDINDED